MEELIRDIAALVNIILGLMVMTFELLAFRAHPLRRWRWVMLFKAAVGMAWVVVSCMALFHLYSSGGIIDPNIGRPVTTLTLLAFVLGAITQFESRGKRK